MLRHMYAIQQQQLNEVYGRIKKEKRRRIICRYNNNSSQLFEHEHFGLRLFEAVNLSSENMSTILWGWHVIAR